MWASNYVANLRADALQAKGLELLGHILDFATLRMRLLPKAVTHETAPRNKGGASDSAVRSVGQAD